MTGNTTVVSPCPAARPAGVSITFSKSSLVVGSDWSGWKSVSPGVGRDHCVAPKVHADNERHDAPFRSFKTDHAARQRPKPHALKQRFAYSITLLLSWSAASRCSTGRSGGPFSFKREERRILAVRLGVLYRVALHGCSSGWTRECIEVTVLVLADPGLPSVVMAGDPGPYEVTGRGLCHRSK